MSEPTAPTGPTLPSGRTVPVGPSRRPPTPAEARALGHPLRLRILFACRDRARTNKELAEALGTTPGTIHYHLKRLVDEDFLRPEEPRPGPRGSTEQPYRSTGKSWQLSGTAQSSRWLLQVGADEVAAAAADDVLTLTRVGLTLPEPDLVELVQRLGELVDEFLDRSRVSPGRSPQPAVEGDESVVLFVALHRTHDVARAGADEDAPGDAQDRARPRSDSGRVEGPAS